LFSQREDVLRLLPRVPQQIGAAHRCLLELLLSPLGGSQSLGYVLLTRVDRARQMRPDEFRREPDKNREGRRLRKQSEIDIHNVLPRMKTGTWKLAADYAQQRIAEGEKHCETDADNERRIDQPEQQKNLGLQRGDKLRLARARFEELAAH